MSNELKRSASPVMVVIAFATVYLVWGSTYFFIQRAVATIPPFILGAIRFIIAGAILLGWCMYKGEKIFNWSHIKPAAISGLLMLFIGNGAVIWAELSLASSLVAVLVSSAPIWFVVLDKPKWHENLTSRPTILGLIVGFIGVILLFSEQTSKALGNGNGHQVIGLIVLIIGAMSWAGGSLYSKYMSTSTSATVNSGWQMMAAGIAFIPSSFANNEWSTFNIEAVTASSWFSLVYLITMGSLAGYSAYVWLLQVRPATQVSTYAYVNPVVAVLLGVLFAHETMTILQIVGLAVILLSVLLINMAKYRKEKKAGPGQPASPINKNITIPSPRQKVVI
ncbi:EamA family transporter [Niastella caeni]|uniref:EamA family transporter n=1 Tax=Niastella caeni TaxID=2569763 RepID=A0A4S8I1G8_9BACT|nr:EamA family transporter [Niastella caeni]THU41897.1 EamA family transporter [Niastella caeni]